MLFLQVVSVAVVSAIAARVGTTRSCAASPFARLGGARGAAIGRRAAAKEREREGERGESLLNNALR